MDRMLPGQIDGLAIIEALRKSGNRTPILILSALSDVDERIRGLQSGGDDYLTKPFAFGELLARLDALSRRAQGGDQTTLRGRRPAHRSAVAQGRARRPRRSSLQPREFKLLEYLMRHAGQVVTRTMLLENVWDYHFDPADQRRGRAHQQAAAEDRRGFGAAAAAHGPQRRLHADAPMSDVSAVHALLGLRRWRSATSPSASLALVLFAAPLWYAWQVTIQDGRAEILRADAQRLADVFHREGAGRASTAFIDDARRHADRRRAHPAADRCVAASAGRQSAGMAGTGARRSRATTPSRSIWPARPTSGPCSCTRAARRL